MATLRSVVSALIVAVVLAAGGTLLLAQNPALRWSKAAPFPEPEEELYGVEAGGKMYVIGGFGCRGQVGACDGLRIRSGR